MSANNLKKSNKREYQGAISKLALLPDERLLSYCLNKDDARIIGIVLDFKAQMATENPEMNNINVEVLDKEPKSRYDEIMEELSLLSDDALLSYCLNEVDARTVGKVLAYKREKEASKRQLIN